MMDRDELEQAIRKTISDRPWSFNLPGIADAITSEYGSLKSLDDIPSEDYWEIVRAYDSEWGDDE